MTSLLYGAFLLSSLRTGVVRRGVGYVKMLMVTATLHVLLFSWRLRSPGEATTAAGGIRGLGCN